MKLGFEVEVREAEASGHEPTLRGVMLVEGRAASGGRREVFTPGSVEWPAAGVVVRTEHRGKAEARGLVVRQSDGRLTVTARATSAIREAVKAGKRYMSVEFHSIEERTTAGGVREVLRASLTRPRSWRLRSTTSRWRKSASGSIGVGYGCNANGRTVGRRAAYRSDGGGDRRRQTFAHHGKHDRGEVRAYCA